MKKINMFGSISSGQPTIKINYIYIYKKKKSTIKIQNISINSWKLVINSSN